MIEPRSERQFISMRASFERGDPAAPRGHALVYFTEADAPDRVWASYLVVAPVVMDLAKLVPPMFATQLPTMPSGGIQALPLPPFPEQVESKAWLERVADARADDLLDGGRIDPRDLQQAMVTLMDLAGEYGRLWSTFAENLPEIAKSEASSPALPDVDEILLDVMTDAERVSRLARLLGTLRYAVEGSDRSLAEETVLEMERVGRRLGPAYRVTELITAARQPGPDGSRLAELYLERCYKVVAEAYAELEQLDQEIARRRGEATS
jgi:hypothetical protein